MSRAGLRTIPASRVTAPDAESEFPQRTVMNTLVRQSDRCTTLQIEDLQIAIGDHGGTGR